eukprot:TRINITY_DN15413_c0_g1_i1.p1 TRINITY_DN15413_c0_g1~~TRINITY_DN15413_c0_g1_i1.p1  ORF type:complete len:921 (+),score=258.57 TRINITY_DN15413_c0_g1_i1:42-2765(+)
MDGGGPKMVPCGICGLLFTSGSLKFHEKSCAKKIERAAHGEGPPAIIADTILVQCTTCSRTFSQGRITKHQEICKSSNIKKREIFDAAKMRGFADAHHSASTAAPERKDSWKQRRESLYTDMQRHKLNRSLNESGETDFVIQTVDFPEKDDDTSTLAPLFDHSVRANDFDAVLFPAEEQASEVSEPKGSSYDKMSPLNTCVLVDGELAPILPAHNELISSPAPQPVTAPAPTPTYRAPSQSTQPPSPKTTHTLEGPPRFKSRSRSVSTTRSPLAPSTTGTRLLSTHSCTPSAPSVPSETTRAASPTPETVLLSVHRAELSKARSSFESYKKGQEEKFNKTVEQLRDQIEQVKKEAHRTIQSEISRERHNSRQREADITSSQAYKDLQAKYEESNALVTKHTRELESLRLNLRTADQERMTLRTSKRQLAADLAACKEELKQYQEKKGSASRKRSNSSSPVEKESHLASELAKVKGELTREKTKNERLQQVLKSRRTQMAASAEMQAANCDRREQQLHQDELFVKKEKESLAAQRAQQERFQKDLDKRSKALESELAEFNEQQKSQATEALRVERLHQETLERQRQVDTKIREMEYKSQEVVMDTHRQTAELKRIAREKERIEAYKEALHQREEAVLERERCIGRVQERDMQEKGRHHYEGRERRMHSVSPVVEAVHPVGIVSPGPALSNTHNSHIVKTPTRGTPRSGRAVPPPPPVPSRPQPSCLTFNSTIEELETRKAEAMMKDDAAEVRALGRKLEALRSGVRCPMGELEVNKVRGVQKVDSPQPVPVPVPEQAPVRSVQPPRTAQGRTTNTPSSGVMSTARGSSRSSSMSTGVSATSAHTKPQTKASDRSSDVVTRIIKSDLASKAQHPPSPTSTFTDTTLTLSDLHIPHAPYHPIPVASINLV